MSAGAVIAIRRKRLVRRFREAGAMDAQHAVRFEDLGERRSWIFDQMIREGVFSPTPDNRFYMDERAALEFLRRRRLRAWVIGGGLVVVFILLWALRIIGR